MSISLPSAGTAGAALDATLLLTNTALATNTAAIVADVDRTGGVLVKSSDGNTYQQYRVETTPGNYTLTWMNIADQATTTTPPAGLTALVGGAAQATTLTSSTETATGNVAIGASSVSIANTGAANAMFNGMTIAAGRADSVHAPEGGVLPVIAFDGTGTTLDMHVVRFA